jgi:hypothetical protein
MGDWLNELHGYDARSTFISTLEHAAVKRELPNEPNVHALSFFIHFRRNGRSFQFYETNPIPKSQTPNVEQDVKPRMKHGFSRIGKLRNEAISGVVK